MAKVPSASLPFNLGGWAAHKTPAKLEGLNDAVAEIMVFGCNSTDYIFVKKYPPERSRVCIDVMEMCHSIVRSTSKPSLW